MADAVRKAVQLAVAPAPQGSSTQAEEEDLWTPDVALPPPLPLEQLAGLTKVSRLRRSCIAAIAHNTVGLGHGFEVREGHEDDVDDAAEASRELTEALDRLSQRDARLKRPSFRRQVTAVIWDKYECGNGYLEVSRDRVDGTIDGLFHVPGKRMRRLRTRDGWIMLTKGGSTDGAIRFYDFGQKVAYDRDGRPTGRLAGNGMRWERNEVLAFQLYTSESRDYGLPPDAQLANDYLGDKLAGDTNVSFFNSNGVPPTVIFVQGEETEEGETVKIEVPPAFLQQVAQIMRGQPGSRGRVAVVGVPSGFEAQVHNLAVTSERDMGFVQYRSDNRRATLGAYRLSPVFVADIEDAGKYTAEVERAITKEQVFDPEQAEVEEILNLSVVGELAPDLAVVFDELAIKGDEANRESADALAGHGRLTNAEYRAAHGYAPLPEAEAASREALTDDDRAAGRVPRGWNAELVPATDGPAPAPTPAGLAKALAQLTAADEPEAPQDLEAAIRADLDAAVDEAVRELHRIDPDVVAEAVIVEKEGDRITIRPRLNGAPA